MNSDDKQARQTEQADAGAQQYNEVQQGREPHNADVDDVAAPVQLPGEFLAARRQQLNLSVEDVAMRVRLAARQIVALEANDFAALPGMATVRGFVRSYAKLLGLDPEPLVAMLVIAPNPTIEPVATRRPLPASDFNNRRYASSITHRRSARRLAGFAAVLLVFVGAMAFIAYRSDWLHVPSSDATSASATDAAEMALGNADGSGAQSSSAPASRPAGENAPQASLALTAANALELRVRDDSWVEVIAVNGERKLLSKLMKSGTSELVEVSEPVVLVVGNAAGVEASLRGQPLNLAAAARENIVKLSLK